jgi:GAF domain-containing protein
VPEDDQLSRLEAALVATATELTRRGTIDPAVGGGEGPAALARLTAAAVAQVPGAAYAGLTLREPGGGLASHAPSDPAIVELDRAQVRLGEGPCVDALQAGESSVVVVDDFAVEHRWPRFAALAQQGGIASLLSFAMAPHDAPPGAVNLYGLVPAAFDATARAIAGAFAAQAAVAVYGARRVEQLNRALASRDVIGRAKGILMERFTLDEAQAFDLLVHSSQDTNL